MMLRSFLLASALALSSASAFLVIPEVEPDAFPGDIWNSRNLEARLPQQQQVDLLCTECPFAIQSGDQTSLSLNFSIDDGVLTANDRQIFPPVPPSVITAVQRRLSDDDVASEPVPLGYAVEMMPIPSPPEEPFDMVEVRFTVLDLDGYPVPLDTVALTLIHDAEGNLYLAKTDIEETADRASWRKCHGKPKCLRRLMLRRIRSMFAAARERLFSIFKGQGCRGVPQPPHHPRPHHGRPAVAGGEKDGHHGHHRPHHHFHDKFHGTWERTMRRVVRFIVVPAVLGVLAGIVVSVLGMLVGNFILFMWHRYRRAPRQEVMEQGSVDEKQGLMTQSSNDLPPAYCDDETTAEQVADKA